MSTEELKIWCLLVDQSCTPVMDAFTMREKDELDIKTHTIEILKDLIVKKLRLSTTMVPDTLQLYVLKKDFAESNKLTPHTKRNGWKKALTGIVLEEETKAKQLSPAELISDLISKLELTKADVFVVKMPGEPFKRLHNITTPI